VRRGELLNIVAHCDSDAWTEESWTHECDVSEVIETYARWNPANPASPLNLYKDGSTVGASVVSVSFFRRASGIVDLAQVRYIKHLRRASGGTEEATHWIATVQYAYAAPSKDLRSRSMNPLGFKVLDFRPEPEVIGEPTRDGEAEQAPGTVEKGGGR